MKKCQEDQEAQEAEENEEMMRENNHREVLEKLKEGFKLKNQSSLISQEVFKEVLALNQVFRIKLVHQLKKFWKNTKDKIR